MDEAEEAREQWECGEVVLYSAGLSQGLLDEKLGFPTRYVADCIISEEERDRIAGHNAEVYRLILALGLPANHRRELLTELKDPTQFWTGDRKRRAGPAAAGWRAQFRPGGDNTPVVLDVIREDRVVATMRLANARSEGAMPEAAWVGGELLFIRYRTNANEGRGFGYLVYDARVQELIVRTFHDR